MTKLDLVREQFESDVPDELDATGRAPRRSRGFPPSDELQAGVDRLREAERHFHDVARLHARRLADADDLKAAHSRLMQARDELRRLVMPSWQ